MTDERQGWGAPEPVTSPQAASAPAGWYPDPWSHGHHRYWDGAAWTGGSFPHGPANPSADEGSDAAELPPGAAPLPPPAVPPPTGGDPWAAPPPEWSSPTQHLTWTPPPRPNGWGPAPAAADDAPQPSRFGSGVGFVALVVGIMVLVGSLGTLGGYLVFRHRSSPSHVATGPPPTFTPIIPGPAPASPATPASPASPASPATPSLPSLPPDPSASALQSLVLTQADVPPTVVVQPEIAGDQVAGQPTLDVCNGTFPSESRRTARLQVAAYNGQAASLLSTEAVLYSNPAATEQAFAELKSVVAACPATPVVSPVGEPTISTHFNAAPDAAWSATPAVTRLAYDFVMTDELGATAHSVAVYFRRGRVLMGVYFHEPDSPQVSVAGQTSIEKIAGVFATRIANLPASVVNG